MTYLHRNLQLQRDLVPDPMMTPLAGMEHLVPMTSYSLHPEAETKVGAMLPIPNGRLLGHLEIQIQMEILYSAAYKLSRGANKMSEC